MILKSEYEQTRLKPGKYKGTIRGNEVTVTYEGEFPVFDAMKKENRMEKGERMHSFTVEEFKLPKDKVLPAEVECVVDKNHNVTIKV